MTNFNPYLHFNGNCAEAMNFYKECLGGELTMDTVGSTPMASQMPPAMHDKILHSQLKSGNITIMASDMIMGAGEMIPGNVMSLCLSGENNEEIPAFFAKLSEGGKVTHPLKEEFFGTFGDFTDKFGISWMVQMEPKKA